jgi:isoquinoline 1-oxidoreductase beta subunit
MFLGGGFGRRAVPMSDWISEAVHVAKAAGAPVKTVWTREDDIRGGYYRPMFLHRVKVGLGADGAPLAWDQTLVGQSIIAGTPFEAALMRNGIDGASVEGASDSPYLAGHRRPSRRPAFAEDRHPGAVVALGRQYAHRVRDGERDRRGCERPPAATRSSTGARCSPSIRGISACSISRSRSRAGASRSRRVVRVAWQVHESFGSYVAEVAEVSIDSGAIRVHRVTCAVDCGVVVNPAGVIAQMESGIAFWPERGAVGRDRSQGRSRPAVELPRLPGAAREPDAGRRRAHRSEHRKIRRRRRAGHAADRTRRRERDRCSHGSTPA